MGTLLILAAGAAFLLPTRIKLELYDVQDITIGFSDFGSSISIAPALVPEGLFDGEDLAGRIKDVVPAPWDQPAGATIQFQNGLLIVRATRTQHTAIGAYLGLTRVRVNTQEVLRRAKTTICATIFGMITK